MLPGLAGGSVAPRVPGWQGPPGTYVNGYVMNARRIGNTGADFVSV